MFTLILCSIDGTYLVSKNCFYLCSHVQQKQRQAEGDYIMPICTKAVCVYIR